MGGRLTGQSVRDVQEMLGTIAGQHPQIPDIRPTGEFDERTLEGVMIFQRDFHLPVTGAVDHATWQALIRQYRQALRRTGEPPALRVMPHAGAVLSPGDQVPQVLLVQARFDALAQVFSGFARTGGDGAFQGATVENTRQLQRFAGLEVTGEMDRAAWDSLVRLYHLFITRSG